MQLRPIEDSLGEARDAHPCSCERRRGEADEVGRYARSAGVTADSRHRSLLAVLSGGLTQANRCELLHGQSLRLDATVGARLLVTMGVLAVDRLPRVPGDLEDHGGDREADQWVGDSHA
jgi:hypothetical protein